MNHVRRPEEEYPQDSDAHEIADTLRRIAKGAWKRRSAFLLVVFSTVLLVQVGVFFWPATYEARAAVLIQQARRPSPTGNENQNSTVVVGEITDEEVNSERAILLSAEVLDKTVQATGMDRAVPPWYIRLIEPPLRLYQQIYSSYQGVPVADGRDRAIMGLGGAVGVERLRDTNVLVISLGIGDPNVAEIILRELLKNYLARQVAVHAAQRTTNFFPAQASVIESELKKLEEDLQRLKQMHGVVDPGLERELALRNLSTLREELAATQRRQVELGGRIASYTDTRTVASAKPYVSTTRGASDLHTQVLQLELEEIALRAKYQPDFRLVVENREKLKAAREALQRQQRDTPGASTTAENPTAIAAEQKLAELEAELIGLDRREREVRQQIAISQKRLIGLDQQVVEAQRLSRMIEVNEAKYKTYLTRAEDARVDTALDDRRITNVTVIQEPTASRKPVWPRKRLMLLVSLGAGILFAFITCAWLELRETKLESILDAMAPRPDGQLPERQHT